MTDATDKWPDGFVPIKFIPASPEIIGQFRAAGGFALFDEAEIVDETNINIFGRRASRAINAFDVLVAACEAAHSWIVDGGMDNDIAAQLSAALAEARKP